MTPDELIRMARQAGAFPELSPTPDKDVAFLARFNELGAAAERKRIVDQIKAIEHVPWQIVKQILAAIGEGK